MTGFKEADGKPNLPDHSIGESTLLRNYSTKPVHFKKNRNFGNLQKADSKVDLSLKIMPK
jgi:hypothetical protein